MPRPKPWKNVPPSKKAARVLTSEPANNAKSDSKKTAALRKAMKQPYFRR